MYVNSNTAISTSKVLLVPYCKHHVPTYHDWMQDVDLRQATASDELSIEEEYAMQRSWRKDHDKLTFIICKPLSGTYVPPQSIDVGESDSPASMVGDINLFLSDDDEDDEPQPDFQIVGEIELMIAQSGHRRQGYGRSALLAFLNYISMHCAKILNEHNAGVVSSSTERTSDLAYLRVKINRENTASIALFKSVGFVLVSTTANYFGELELRLDILQVPRERLVEHVYNNTDKD